MPGMVPGSLLTFIPASGDYVNAQSSAAPGNTMIGNKIQSLYLKQTRLSRGRGALVPDDGADARVVLVYIRLAGTEAFMGDEEEAPG